MNTKDKRITEAYYEVIAQREKEIDHIKKDDIVENKHGIRFTVETISKDFEEIKEYDKTGECASYIKYSRLVNENTYWVAVRDKYNEMYVYPYNDEGIHFVEEANTAETTYKGHNSMMEAYMSVLNPVEENGE